MLVQIYLRMEIHREAATPIYYWDIHPVEDYVAIKKWKGILCILIWKTLKAMLSLASKSACRTTLTAGHSLYVNN